MGCGKINCLVLRRCFVDLILYLSVLILLLAIYKHLIPPTTGFFNCNDPTIWLPYKGDTFSTKVLISVVFISFFVFVFLTELSVSLSLSLTPGVRMKIAALSTASTFLTFFFGFTWNVAINLVMKTLSAVPRPHFIDTCNPDWTLIDCDKYNGNVEYNISHCQVSEDEQKEVFDAMKSFPSGHAQVACFTAAFLIVYLEHRLEVGSLLARVWLQLALLIMAAVSSLSRITDNRHHASDVLAGAMLGITIGLVTAARLKYDVIGDKESAETKKQIGLLGWTIGNSSRNVSSGEKHPSPDPNC